MTEERNIDPDEVLDLWFSSDAWHDISKDAENGDPDSVELMEKVNEQLGNLIFHLQNESPFNKVIVELMFFEKLCKDFDIL